MQLGEIKDEQLRPHSQMTSIFKYVPVRTPEFQHFASNIQVHQNKIENFNNFLDQFSILDGITVLITNFYNNEQYNDHNKNTEKDWY